MIAQLMQIKRKLEALQIERNNTQLATRTDRGMVQLVEITYDKAGQSTVIELTGYLTLNEFISL